MIRFYAIPPVEAVRYWPAVEGHLRRACERSVGDISTDTLLADCRAGAAHLLLTCRDDTILAAAVARFCLQADGTVACELVAAGGGSLRAWQHVIPDFEAWARHLGAMSVRLCGRPGWERIFRGYRRRPLISLSKDL
nr:hypothetical protein [Methylobacterium sp. L1A1]